MMNILICEDDAVIAADLAYSIEAAGHRVQGVYASARELLACRELPTPDLAIIDLSLRDGNTGAAVAQKLQSAGARVVIVSGYTNVNAGLGSIPHTFAAKPISDELVRALLSGASSPAAADAA